MTDQPRPPALDVTGRAAIRARADAATKGPWEADDPWTVPPYQVCVEHEPGVAPALHLIIAVEMQPTVQGEPTWIAPGFWRSEDADFIAHARQDVPALLDALDATDAALAALDEEFDTAAAAYLIVQAERDTARTQAEAYDEQNTDLIEERDQARAELVALVGEMDPYDYGELIVEVPRTALDAAQVLIKTWGKKTT